MTLADLQKNLNMSIAPNTWPQGGVLTAEWVHHLASSMEHNSRSGEPPRNLSKCVSRLSPDAP